MGCSGFEGGGDSTASETFLRKQRLRSQADGTFEWDAYDWLCPPQPDERPKELRTDPQVASVGR